MIFKEDWKSWLLSVKCGNFPGSTIPTSTLLYYTIHGLLSPVQWHVYTSLLSSDENKSTNKETKIRGYSSQSTIGMMPVVGEMLKARNVVSLLCVTHILDSIHLWQLGLQSQLKTLNINGSCSQIRVLHFTLICEQCICSYNWHSTEMSSWKWH